MDKPDESAQTASAPPRDSLVAEAGMALEQAVRVAEAALGLLRAELRLARSSALALVWLAFLLIFLGAGAWLASSAAIAAAIYELTGNVFYGIGAVALANMAGVAWVLLAMRRCWSDLMLPRTRKLIGDMRAPP